jgi:hypothetical protein
VNEDLMEQFAQIQRYANGLQRLLVDAQAVAPHESKGADTSGAVTVRLGADGIPQSFRIAQDWHRRLAPETFGLAVVEACQAAIGDRLSTWTNSLTEDGWQDKVERLKGGPADPAPSKDNSARVPPAFRDAVATAQPRPATDLAEEVIRSLVNVETFTPPATPLASGTAARGKLAVTLSSTGLTSCTVDAAWVARQTATTLMNELGTAIRAAREMLQQVSEAAEPAAGAEPTAGIDRLLAESIALLNNPARLA